MNYIIVLLKETAGKTAAGILTHYKQKYCLHELVEADDNIIIT